jgi:hypothetical protein
VLSVLDKLTSQLTLGRKTSDTPAPTGSRARLNDTLRTIGWTVPTGAAAGAAIGDVFLRLQQSHLLTPENLKRFSTLLSEDRMGKAVINATDVLKDNNSYFYQFQSRLSDLKKLFIDKLAETLHIDSSDTNPLLHQVSDILSKLNTRQMVDLTQHPESLLKKLGHALDLEALPGIHNVSLDGFLANSHIPAVGLAALVGAGFTGLIGGAMAQVFHREKQQVAAKIAKLQTKANELDAENEVKDTLDDLKDERDELDDKLAIVDTRKQIADLTAELAALEDTKTQEATAAA